jgi:hypothetical protein
MKLLESFGQFNKFSHRKTSKMLNFGYWGCNIIIFNALFNTFFFKF